MTTTRSRLSACLHSLKQASVSIASHALLTFLIDYEELRKTRQQAAEAKAEAAKVADHLKSAAEAARLASALELTTAQAHATLARAQAGDARRLAGVRDTRSVPELSREYGAFGAQPPDGPKCGDCNNTLRPVRDFEEFLFCPTCGGRFRAGAYGSGPYPPVRDLAPVQLDQEPGQLNSLIAEAAAGTDVFAPNRDPDDLAQDAIAWTEGRCRADHAQLNLDPRTLRYCGWRAWHWLAKSWVGLGLSTHHLKPEQPAQLDQEQAAPGYDPHWKTNGPPRPAELLRKAGFPDAAAQLDKEEP